MQNKFAQYNRQMLLIEYTSQFKRDVKRAKKRHLALDKLEKIMELLLEQRPILRQFKDHALSGNWAHHRELHIEPDWLLIYRYAKERNTVIFVRTGTHADLFE